VKSQGDLTLEALFEGRPEALRLFQAVRLLIEGLGPVNIVITKTQVSFGTERKFACARAPGSYTFTGTLAPVTDAMTITFRLPP
jgi:hypothetical protein